MVFASNSNWRQAQVKFSNNMSYFSWINQLIWIYIWCHFQLVCTTVSNITNTLTITLFLLYSIPSMQQVRLPTNNRWVHRDQNYDYTTMLCCRLRIPPTRDNYPNAAHVFIDLHFYYSTTSHIYITNCWIVLTAYGRPWSVLEATTGSCD